MSLRSALMFKMALNQQQAGSLTVESSEFLNTIENVTNTGNGALFEESKPGPSKEHSPTFFDNIITPDLSSELNSDQEQALAEMLEFVEDSDCSLKDKDYVPESPAAEREPDTSSFDNENILVITGDKVTNRWKKSRPENWKKNVAKKRRFENKAPTFMDSTKCRLNCSANISEERRVVLCQNFWALDFNRRKDFILSNVDSHRPIRIKSNPSGKKRPRTDSKEFYFNLDDTKLRVCKAFFTKTLCISKEVVEHAFLNKGEGKIFTGFNKRGRGPPKNKTNIDDIERVKQHIESFPVMESHYTRISTKRKYLDCKLSINKMYSMYKKLCEHDGTSVVSSITYRRIFCNNYNYSFFTPTKDQCQLCTQYKTNDEETKKQLQTQYEEHVARKEDCYTAKARDKARAMKDSNFVCATFDLQCVLQIPSSDTRKTFMTVVYCTSTLCHNNITNKDANNSNNIDTDGFKS
ncbi:unnamed protein product [Diabrotica balteata]|uniref:Uncharacterized protein n=1 Tax=Diabrotica balteata TaxID=107213 RepID=A0A9N9SX05_DIABA|nr:unnamed protein product [Diabrotica balteata]